MSSGAGLDAAPGDFNDVTVQVPQPQRVGGDRHHLPRLPPTGPPLSPRALVGIAPGTHPESVLTTLSLDARV